MFLLYYIRRLINERYDIEKSIKERKTFEEELRELKKEYKGRFEIDVTYPTELPFLSKLKIKFRDTTKPVPFKIIPPNQTETKKDLEEIVERFVIRSQTIGHFYILSEEGLYIKEGDTISEGSIIGRVNSLKIDDKIKFSPTQNNRAKGDEAKPYKVIKIRGEERYEPIYITRAIIKKILVNNGDPIEYGHELLEIEP